MVTCLVSYEGPQISLSRKEKHKVSLGGAQVASVRQEGDAQWVCAGVREAEEGSRMITELSPSAVAEESQGAQWQQKKLEIWRLCLWTVLAATENKPQPTPSSQPHTVSSCH